MAIFKRGDTGPEIAEIQKLLGIISDGDFGPATQRAVITFQTDNDLLFESGEVGPTTLRVLEANPNVILLESKNLSPIDVRKERNQNLVNKQSTISSVIDPNDINTATPNDAKPQGLQRLGKLIVDLCLKLKDFFLPQLTALLLEYGIDQLQSALDRDELSEEELKNRFCPTPERLEALIIQRNNLAGVLNNTGSQLDTISAGVNFSGQFSELLQALVNGLKGAEFILNQAAKLIPLIPGAIVSTVNDLGTIADVTLTLPDGTPIIPKIKSIVTSVAPPFALVQQIILQCVNLLDALDELILLCDPNATLTATSNTIDGIVTTQLIAEETETGNTYKGFTLEIETRAYTPKVDQNRAVGKNNFGIVMVFTDYSFASNPNVLIDELKFIIDRDNLKAY